ncbi:hypothetical protein PUNSTDRAFT_122374 [Punctularia strigosozonata HHB-11173 SS5]|uniref:uncharacterized protein n=1 Tax=Punctularia strigosozonata (strain HHB-11173) TaxID=741275 RepID=UPI0004416F83|nr:uncharacterized protein PUNSTDRAFT_122374 [Punctularia strigosozonata HHB-11173 SS5]EIN05472.1 hypothetical protein PUNSTDRAFT_122374 [Punctularia strigosozonata HHB-11173 SS5]
MPARAPDFEGSPYRAPDGAVRRFIWRRKMWAEATFALSMLEPWEKVVVWSIFLGVAVLFLCGLYQYLPHHLDFLRRRAMYYFLGEESGESVSWLTAGASWAGSGGKEL